MIKEFAQTAALVARATKELVGVLFDPATLPLRGRKIVLADARHAEQNESKVGPLRARRPEHGKC